MRQYDAYLATGVGSPVWETTTMPGAGPHYNAYFTGGVCAPLREALVSTAQGYEFTGADGQVMTMELVNWSGAANLPLPTNATFSVGTASVTETITGLNATRTVEYSADATNSDIYHVTESTMTVTAPTTTTATGNASGYSFTITDGAVTAVQQVFANALHSYSHTVPASPTATFSVEGTAVTEISIHGNMVETVQFVQPGGSTLYAVASDSKAYIQPGTATTLLSVDAADRAHFTFDSAGHVTQVQSVSLTGQTGTVVPNSYVTYAQLEPGFVQETTTIGTRSSYEVFHDANGDGIYTEVAHGLGSTVDLVGLKAQLAQIPASLDALV